MKTKKLAAIIALLGIAAVGIADPSWVEFESGAEGQAPQLTVLESSFAGTTINLKTFGMWVEDVKEGEETYQRITLPTSHTGEVGKPMLPVISRSIAIPPTSGVKVEVEVNEEKVYKDYLVYPFQHPEPKPETEKGFKKNREFYDSDVSYPVELSEVGAPAIMNDVRLVHLSIQPFRYNPKTKELTVATDLTIRLDYSGIDERNQLERQPSYLDPQWKRLYRSLILNFDDIYGSAKINDVVLPVQYYILYLIIYAHDFRPEVCPKLADFIEWKTRKGCYVDAVDLNSIPGIDGQTDDVEDVKDYIYDWWYNDGLIYPGPVSRYVLLVGDAPGYNPYDYENDQPGYYESVQCAYDSLIPTFGTFDYDCSYGGAYWLFLFSDYYYQLVAGTDSLPDLCLGRWCCRIPAELSAYVDKTINYDTAGSSNWHPERTLYVAYRGDAVGGTSFQDTKEYIANNIYYPYCELYADEGAVTQDVINEIESANGYGFVNYCGHGSKTSWPQWDLNDGSLTSSQVMDLGNTARFPIVYNMCCYNACITYYSDAWDMMVEAWTRNPDGGAAGALGASLISWIYYNNTQDSVMFRAHFDEYLQLNCGMGINYGKVYILQGWPTSSFAKENAWMYYWIGDPELDVWRGQPQEAYAEYNAVCNPPDPHLVVTVYLDDGHQTPVEGAQVCIHKDGEYHAVTYTNSSGAAYLPLPPSWSSVVVTNQKGPICIIPILDVFFLQTSCSMDVEESFEKVEWQLKPVYPNPLRSRATISYSVAGKLGSKGSQHIELSIFDVSGREVKVLASGEQSPGHYEVIWNGKDAKGAKCPSGVYFIRMYSNEFKANERIVLLR